MNKKNEKLEQAILGILIDNYDALSHVTPIIEKLEYFQDKKHQIIYTSLLSLEGEKWDTLIVGSYLQKINKLKQIGGYAYLGELSCAYGFIGDIYALVRMYARFLKEEYYGRELELILSETKKMLTTPDDRQISSEFKYSFYSVAEKAIEKLSEIRSKLSYSQDVFSVAETVPEIIRDIELVTKGEKTPALKTKFKSLDNLLGGGLYPAEMNIIAARPSIGKTSLALNIANNLSPETKIFLISLETTIKSLIRDRLFTSSARITSTKLRTGDLDSEDYDKLFDAVHEIGSYKQFKICDRAIMSISDIEMLIRNEAETNGIDLLIIDYLQLIRPQNNKENREQQIANISLRLKGVIKQYKMYSLILAQLNRESERAKRAPIMSDLRESGQLEQDADTIIFLHKDKEVDNDLLSLIVAKNKNGAKGELELHFNKSFTKFEEI